MKELEYLIHPVDATTFFQFHWARQPLVINRDSPHYYERLFSGKDLDQLLSYGRLRYPEVTLHRKNSAFPFELLVSSGWLSTARDGESAPDLTALYRAYAEGYTINVRADSSWPPVTFLCRQIESVIHHRATAGVFMTPSKSQGFPLHFDTFEIFILQLEGVKHWRVYAPLKERPDPHTTESLEDFECRAGDPLQAVTLQPGDFLHIPRGFLHQGLTSDKSSLHLSLGIYPFEWKDLIVEALKIFSEQDERLNMALPPGFMNDGSFESQCQQQMQELLILLCKTAEATTAIRRLERNFCVSRGPLADGHFAQVDNLRAITTETMVEKRPGVPYQFCQKKNTAVLHLCRDRLIVSQQERTALEFVTGASGPFAVRCIPGIRDANAKVELVRRLVVAGLLRVAIA